MATSEKPLVLICSTPIYGHLMPIRAIAKELVARGYEITFITGSAYRQIIEEIGARFIPLSGYGDFTEADIPTRWPIRDTLTPGPEQLTYDMEHCFIRSIPSQYEAQQAALKMLNEDYPGRQIVLVSEAIYLGSLPGMAGAPGRRPTATLSIGIIPMTLNSIDCAPFGPGLAPDSSPEGRERNKAMNKGLQEQVLVKPDTVFKEIMQEMGAKTAEIFVFDAAYLYPDRFLQMCIPSVEYPRSDAPPSIRFAGGLPKGKRDAFANPPTWWSEVVDNNGKKKIVAISQGSIAMNFSDLVIPTMGALKDREDTLVVVALGRKGAALPEGTNVPANARVADFIPFDELLPHCAAFISNGGYGAFQHAISNGTPLVVGGASEDKPEVAARAEWAGVAVNLRTAQPTVEALRTAIDEVISNPKYKKRALELEEEMARFDPMSIVAENIEELAAGKHLN